MRKLTTEDFIEKATKSHGDKYSYGNSDYVDSKTKVCIICPEHGEFWQIPANHLFGKGCPKCGIEKKRLSQSSNADEFINKAIKLHGLKYDYSNVVYVTCEDKVEIVCPKHGNYYQTPSSHLSGSGCPECGVLKRSERKRNFHLSKRNWNFEQPEDYKLIPLTQGKYAMVDNEDFDRVKDINWHFTKQGYASSYTVGLMHRFIMNAPDNLDIDHIYHDKLDNRKSQLRLAKHCQNMSNSRHRKGTSKYKGVNWDITKNKWVSGIMLNYKRIHIGYFTDEEEAAKAYDKKALELFGEFAYLNFKIQ